MIESFHLPEKVEFDPTNEEHIEALAFLVFFRRQHATLRFRFNPEEYDTAFEAILKSFVKHYIPKHIYEKVYREVEERIARENRARMEEARKEAKLEQMPDVEEPVFAPKVHKLRGKESAA